MERAEIRTGDVVTRFFGVATDPQSYRNLLYLLLSFPLGLAYFVFLVTGLSLGVALTIALVGLPILAVVLFGWYTLAAFEREQAVRLLNVRITPVARPCRSGMSIADRLLAVLREPFTWKGLFFLLAKLPFGIVNVTLVAGAFGMAFSLVTAPLTYQYTFIRLGVTDSLTMTDAVLLSLTGVLAGVAALHLLNALASVHARFAALMLGEE